MRKLFRVYNCENLTGAFVESSDCCLVLILNLSSKHLFSFRGYEITVGLELGQVIKQGPQIAHLNQ